MDFFFIIIRKLPNIIHIETLDSKTILEFYNAKFSKIQFVVCHMAFSLSMIGLKGTLLAAAWHGVGFNL